MDGNDGLRQFAHLLRVGADAARDVAILRPKDVDAIERLANRAVAMATELDALIAAARGGSHAHALLDAFRLDIPHRIG